MKDRFKSPKPSAEIRRVEKLDEHGEPMSPPSYEYWVVIMSSTPVVKSIAASFSEAFANLENLGYELKR